MQLLDALAVSVEMEQAPSLPTFEGAQFAIWTWNLSSSIAGLLSSIEAPLGRRLR